MTERLKKSATVPSSEIDAELLRLIEDMGCLRGIPGCKGHEDKGGFVEIEASQLRIWESDATL